MVFFSQEKRKNVLCLVSCGKTKAKYLTRARWLYTSGLFRRSLQWAERNCEHVAILSARHGLVAPNTILEPYNTSIEDLSEEELLLWGKKVKESILTEYPNCKILALAGSKYIDAIDLEIVNTFSKLKIGQRLRWLKDNHILPIELLDDKVADDR